MFNISRCLYCRKKESSQDINLSIIINGQEQQIETVACSEKCKEDINKFVKFNNESANNFSKIGIGGLLLLSFLLILRGIGVDIHIMPYLMVFLGVVFLLYPLATWGVYKRVGIRNATWVIRILAALLIALGIYNLI